MLKISWHCPLKPVSDALKLNKTKGFLKIVECCDKPSLCTAHDIFATLSCGGVSTIAVAAAPVGERFPGQEQCRGQIPGRNPYKSLKSFPPCYSQSPLLRCLEISITSNSSNLCQFLQSATVHYSIK
jgi:hypothetical protein